MEATVILARCKNNKNLFGMRTQKMSDGDWWRTWAFKINERSAKNEKYDSSEIKGNLFVTEEYPGCPFCQSMSFVICNKCERITCWNGENVLNCSWCGNVLDNIQEATDKLTVKGESF
ncbi:MAG: TerY-C metal binding domain-containing protein [Ruminococcus sp.]|nr:TerY-C metal binding domain-containing protein [Ruminococcus sp.]